MAKVNADKYGKGRPKVTIEDLEGGEYIVLTIAKFGEETFNDEVEGQKITPYLTFEETGDKVHWLNKTQVGYLIDRLGDDDARWVGKPVPLERHTPEFKGKRQPEKLWVSPPEEWDDLLRQAGHGRHASRPAAAKRPAKVAAKKKK